MSAITETSHRSAVERVLITVLAAPQPSTQYGDTVCVAGIRLDRQPHRWVRLYPVPYRAMTADHQFKKYDIVTVHTSTPRGDSRAESRVLDRERITVDMSVPPWRERIALVQPLVTDDMCALVTESKASPNAPSLAAVRPVEVAGITFEEHGPWSAEDRTKLEAFAAQDTLFGEAAAPMLEAPRLKAKYRYRCGSRKCGGHHQGILDWEIVALQRRLRGESSEALRQALRTKFFEDMCGPSRSPVFFVGNQAKRRHVWSVLGVLWPAVTESDQLDLGPATNY